MYVNINNIFSEEDVSIDPNKEATLEEQNDAILNKLRDVYKRLNKIDPPPSQEELNAKDVVDHDLRSWLVGLNKVVKQLKRNKKLNIIWNSFQRRRKNTSI